MWRRSITQNMISPTHVLLVGILLLVAPLPSSTFTSIPGNRNLICVIRSDGSFGRHTSWVRAADLTDSTPLPPPSTPTPTNSAPSTQKKTTTTFYADGETLISFTSPPPAALSSFFQPHITAASSNPSETPVACETDPSLLPPGLLRDVVSNANVITCISNQVVVSPPPSSPV